MINDIQIEICIGNVEDAIIASKYPIDRIELNSALELGGLSSSIETLKYLKSNIDKKICCMIRPRGGDFNYTDLEFEIMMSDAKNMLENGADGIVFGFLNSDNTIDIDKTSKMSELIHSYNKEAIFHKAFDEIDDLDLAIKQLIDLKINRILTSGKAEYPNIIEGCERLKILNDKYSDKIEILPGGGVRVDNIVDVLKVSNCKQIHMTSKMNNLNGYLQLDEKQLIQLLNKLETI